MTLTEVKKNLDVSSAEEASPKAQATDDEEDEKKREVDPNPVPDEEKSAVLEFIEKNLGDDFNVREVYFVLIAACIIALNQGFVNGVCMSDLLLPNITNAKALEKIAKAGTEENDNYPTKQMIAGFAGAFTNTATSLVTRNWTKLNYNLYLILSYMAGACFAAAINGKAKEYVIEPTYGPTFVLGGLFLLAASIVAEMFPEHSQIVFCSATASGGVANGIASIYSANLIRCTLTGATTDIAIYLAQYIYGNNKNFPKACVLVLIIFWFWIGGIIGYVIVQEMGPFTLLLNAGLFLSVGFIYVYYTVKEIGVSVSAAIFGIWKWKDVIKKLSNEDGELTQEQLIAIYEKIDEQGDSDGYISVHELREGLRRSNVKMTEYEIKTLFRAADENGDGQIDGDEWRALVEKIL